MPADIIAYVIPYVVAFVGIDYGSVPKLLGFCVFFLLLLVINQRAGQILMNPVLVVFGWKLYEVEYVHHQGSEPLVGRALARAEPTTDVNYDMGTLQDLLVLRVHRQGGGNDGDA